MLQKHCPPPIVAPGEGWGRAVHTSASPSGHQDTGISVTPLNLHPNPQDLTLGETSQVSQRQVSSYPALRGSVLTVCSPVLG